MEDVLPYSEDLHLDAGTARLILNLLRSIRSAAPVNGSPGPRMPEDYSERRSLDHIERLCLKAKQRSGELDGIFNPDELERYIRYVSYYQEIIRQMEEVLDDMRYCRDLAHEYAGGMAGILEEHLQMTNNPDAQIASWDESARLKIV